MENTNIIYTWISLENDTVSGYAAFVIFESRRQSLQRDIHNAMEKTHETNITSIIS